MPENEDIINGMTPIERELRQVHPRLHFTAALFARIQNQLAQEPWSRFLVRVQSLADAGQLPYPALLYRLTGEQQYLDDVSRQLVRQTFPGASDPDLLNLALTYDWLYHDLDAETRGMTRDCIAEAGEELFHQLARHEIYWADTYTCNHLASFMLALTTAGVAIHGDGAPVGPWLRFALEKLRLMTDALGADGASQEGICYGGFYAEYYIRALDLAHDLLGWDFFRDNRYLQNVPYFHLYSMLPRDHLHGNNVHLCFADGVRYNWFGPDYFLRKLASRYRNPYAQWAADIQDCTGAARSSGAFLNFAWYDPSLPAQAPDDLPRGRHFTDKDLVLLRSGWDGNEAVFGFHCGPHAGHRALNNYQQSIGAGHMAPDAGSFQLFAHGDWLLADGGYAMKFTAYRNTVLVNGIGQTGEGGEWFECIELRRERRAPSILRVQQTETCDYLIGNAAPAYEHRAGLRKFLRHVLYVRPDCWVIVDELAAAQPSTFEFYLHAFEKEFQADRPFIAVGPNAWRTGGERGALRITALLPDGVEGCAEEQFMKGIGPHIDRTMCTLRLKNRTPAAESLFVTVLEAHPANVAPRFAPALVVRGQTRFLTLAGTERTIQFAFAPGQADPSTPIFQQA